MMQLPGYTQLIEGYIQLMELPGDTQLITLTGDILLIINSHPVKLPDKPQIVFASGNT